MGAVASKNGCRGAAAAVLFDGAFRVEFRNLTNSSVHARFLSTALEDSDRSCATDASLASAPSEPLHCVTWERAIELWQSPEVSGSTFRRITVNALKTVEFDAFYWETPPFSGATASKTSFEFVALDAPGLKGTVADGSAFSEHLATPPPPPPLADNNVGQFRVFENLGRDAWLVSPPDIVDRSMSPNTMAHLASFIRGAPDSMKLQLFSALGRTLSREISGHDSGLGAADGGGERTGGLIPLWVNTEGSGVPFLHVRIDRRPKYIHYEPYRVWLPAHGHK
jgi:hypothetical protein